MKKFIKVEHLKKLPGKVPGAKHVARLRGKSAEVIPESAVPHITNETIAEHREEVLAGARKYIYPLQHSKHRIVLISSGIFIVTVIAFFSYCVTELYKFQSTSTFVYRVTQVVPFPIAHTKGRFISYESYLFELRHYMHYYEKQQKLSFSTEAGQQQLNDFKKRALERVVSDAYVKKMADEKNISVTNKEVDQQVAIVRSQNRLGSSEQVFADVLRDFYGWSTADFRRSLRQQLLAQKVASSQDTEAHTKAEQALAKVRSGAAFGDAAKEFSQDPATKDANGEYPAPIDKTNRDLPPQAVDAMFKLKAGEVSGVVDTGYSLEIIKVNGFEGEKVRAAHIQINLKDINEFINPIKDQQKTREFVKV